MKKQEEIGQTGKINRKLNTSLQTGVEISRPQTHPNQNGRARRRPGGTI